MIFRQLIFTHDIARHLGGVGNQTVRLGQLVLMRRIGKPENTHHWEKDHCTAGLQFNKTGTDQFCM